MDKAAHQWNDKTCSVCNKDCETLGYHDWDNGTCKVCSKVCGENVAPEYVDGTCKNCNKTCDHGGENNWANAILTTDIEVNEGTVQNVGVEKSYFNGQDYVGGVAGRNYFGTVKNCYNTGNVTNTYNSTNTAAYAGGVAGRNTSGAEVSNCYNIADNSNLM